MYNTFQKIRLEILDKKIKRYSITTSIFALFTIIMLFLGILNNIAFLYIFVPFLIITAKQLKTLETGKKIKNDITATKFYRYIREERQIYEMVIQDISYELYSECLYKNNNIYLTKNWLIDFNEVDTVVINLDQMVWAYGVNFQGTSYLNIHLDDGNEYSTSLVNINSVINILTKNRKNILIGYSNKYETLCLEDKTIFIENIKNGNFPTRQGTWGN